LNTLKFSVIGTAFTLLFAYPLAYYLAVKAGHKKIILLALIIVPFWTSMLIRTYAWTFLLGSNGVPAVLAEWGLPELRLLNTPFAIVLGIVYNYLPLMLLPIYVSLERLDPSLRAASKDLGATRWGTFRQVTLPLSAPGLLGGCLLVLIPVMGEYLIPVLLGGGRSYFLGNALADLFLQSRNWPLGAALAAAFIALMTVILLFYGWFSRRVSGSPRAEVTS
jgi:spermidine/putrescine transport system permease protein